MNQSDFNNLEDKTLICCDCRGAFTWTPGEQLYHKSKKLSPVKRCYACHQARKASLIPDQAVRNG